MKLQSYKLLITSVVFFLIGVFGVPTYASRWYKSYEKGLKEMERENWTAAIQYFKEAIKVQPRDTKKIRTYGMHFIEYFPHREIGIAFYHLGEFEKAKRRLQLSLRFQYSARAQKYLNLVLKHVPPSSKPAPRPRPAIVQKPVPEPEEKVPPPIQKQPPPVTPTPPSNVKLVGERLSVAVLPFKRIGATVSTGELDIQDKIITTLVNQRRFKVFERAQLDKILEEQKLGMAGVVDISTAAEIGKVIGVDAVMCGSITLAQRSVSIDARLVDTETAVILSAKDDYSSNPSLQNIKNMIENLTLKINNDFPLVEGYVIGVDGENISVDLGSKQGLRRGMKCIVYREGEEIKHPITGESLGRKTEELGEIRLIEVFDEYSVAKVTKSKDVPLKVGDRVVTK